MNIYKKILIVLVSFLFLNIAYNLNSYTFKKDILETISFQTFKDLKAKDNSSSNEEKTKAKLAIEDYIENIIHNDLERRNNIVDSLLSANISLIVICLLSWLFHYVYIQKNKKAIVLKGLTVLSICWLIIISTELKIKVFLGSGLLPVILIFGVIWVIEEFRKNKSVK